MQDRTFRPDFDERSRRSSGVAGGFLQAVDQADYFRGQDRRCPGSQMGFVMYTAD